MALLFPVAHNNKLAWIDDTGRIVHESSGAADLHVANYTGGTPSDALEAMERGGKWGFETPTGRMLAPHWDQAGQFREGLGSVALYFGPGHRQSSIYRWGFVDEQGDIAIAPSYTNAWAFRRGTAYVQFPDAADLQSQYGAAQWGLINAQGESLIEPRWDYVHAHADADAVVVSAAGRAGHLDRAGRVLVPACYDLVGQFSDGVARVMVRSNDRDLPVSSTISPRFDGTMGLVDSSGKEVVSCQALPAPTLHTGHEMYDFQDGLARLDVNGKAGFWDKTGEVCVDPRFADVSRFSNGLAAATEGRRWGYIDKTGGYRVEPKFEYANSFHQGLAAVQQKVSQLHPTTGRKRRVARWGFVDAQGDTAIPCQFKQASDFHDGLALVITEDDKWAYVDLHGNVVWRQT
jgi:hypothetical protein